jgi:hypothetical protein
VKVEIEADLHGEAVHIRIGGELVAEVEARGDYYRTPPEMRIARSVASWFAELEEARRWAIGKKWKESGLPGSGTDV